MRGSQMYEDVSKKSVEEIRSYISECAKKRFITSLGVDVYDHHEHLVPGINDRFSDELVCLCKEAAKKPYIDPDILDPYESEIEGSTMYSNCVSVEENIAYAGDYENFRQYVDERISEFLDGASELPEDCETYVAALRGSRKVFHWSHEIYGVSFDELTHNKGSMEYVAKRLIEDPDPAPYITCGNRAAYRDGNAFSLIEIVPIPKGSRYNISCDISFGCVEISFSPEYRLSDGSDFDVDDFLKRVLEGGKFSSPSIPYASTITKRLKDSQRDCFRISHDETLIVRAKDYPEFERKLDRYGKNIICTHFRKYYGENQINRAYEALTVEEARAAVFSLAVLKSILNEVCKYTEDYKPICIEEYRKSKITTADLELIYDTLYKTCVKQRPYMYYSVMTGSVVYDTISRLRFDNFRFHQQINSLPEIVKIIHKVYDVLCEAYVRVDIPKYTPPKTKRKKKT